LDGFPTWSWASINAAVRSPSRNWDGEAVAIAYGLSASGIGRDVEWNRTRTTTNISLKAVFVSSRRSLILDLRGQLQPVFIGQFIGKYCDQGSQDLDHNAEKVAAATPTSATPAPTSTT